MRTRLILCLLAIALVACGGSSVSNEDAGTTPQQDSGPPPPPPPDSGPTPQDAGPAPEVCTPSDGSAPADENGDGTIDENCEWHFGVPHPVVDVHVPSSSDQYYPRLSLDGLRLYTTAVVGTTYIPFVSTRASRSARFGSPQPVQGDWLGVNVYVISLTGDELELYAQIPGATRQGIYRATRTSTSAPFSRPELVTEAFVDATHDSRHPFVSADGLELFFSSYDAATNVIYRLRRTDRNAAWGTPEPVTITSAPSAWLEGPSLSPDGLTLFFSGVTGSAYYAYSAQRTSRSSAAFGASSPVLEGIEAIEVSYAPQTQELWINARGDWSPTAGWSLWRARVCRDGACPAQEITCPSPAVRSPDGLHCYSLLSSAPWDASRTACAGMSTAPGTRSHLASMHSPAEMGLIWETFNASRAPYIWVGAYDDMASIGECGTDKTCPWGWASGEPWTYAGWSPSEPSNAIEDCMVLWDGVGFGDDGCTAPRPSICESELWPTW